MIQWCDQIIPHSESKAPILGSSQESAFFESEQNISQQREKPTSTSSQLSSSPYPKTSAEKTTTLPQGCVNVVESTTKFNEFKSFVLDSENKFFSLLLSHFSSLYFLCFVLRFVSCTHWCVLLLWCSRMVCWSVVWRDDSTNFRPSPLSVQYLFFVIIH
jgi:hypothetical protein